MAKKITNNEKNLAAEQREYQVGNKKPPKEHQFKPGESGNPEGPPAKEAHSHR